MKLNKTSVIVAVFSIFAITVLSGCVARGNIYSGIKTGNQAVVNEAASMPMGANYSEKLVMPSIKKLPIKIQQWSFLDRPTRKMLEPFVHISGDYLPVTLKMEVGTHPAAGGMQNGSSAGIMVMKMTHYSDYAIFITNWTEDANILMDIPVSGKSVVYNKTTLGGGNYGSAYVTESMNIAKHNVMVNIVKELDKNREKLESLYAEYQKSKEVF